MRPSLLSCCLLAFSTTSYTRAGAVYCVDFQDFTLKHKEQIKQYVTAIVSENVCDLYETNEVLYLVFKHKQRMDLHATLQGRWVYLPSTMLQSPGLLRIQ